MPPARRIVFAGLETLVLALPAAILIKKLGGFHGATSDSIAEGLVVPFFIGVCGMMIWIFIYMTADTKYSRIGLFSLLGIFIFYLAATPTTCYN